MSTTGRRRGSTRWFVAGSAATVLAVLYVAGWYFTGDRVPGGTVVAGARLGGLTADEAISRLDRRLDTRIRRPVELTYQGRTFPVVPADAGLSFDIGRTVSAAGGGRTWNPVQMADTYFGSRGRITPVVRVDSAAFDASLGEIASLVNRPPVEPSVRFSATGDPRITTPRPGVSMDYAAARRVVVGQLLNGTGAGELPVDKVPPTVDAAEFRRDRRELVRPAVSGPIRLELPGRSLPLKVRDYAEAVSFEVTDGKLAPVIDVGTLRKHLDDVVRGVGAPPADAAVVLRGGRPVVIPDRPGVTVAAKELADAILPALTKTGPARAAKVGTTTRRADFTTRDARRLGVKQVVSDFVTYFPYAEYRNINQSRAAELINGTLLKPGELFSLNDTVGERTVQNGFTVGFVISDGVFAEELGGGVSQVATTTYNAAFFAGLQDVEHQPHSLYIDRYPMGREATVAWPTVDLKFRNDTPYGVLIQAWVVPSTPSSQGEMHVRMWSTKVWDIQAGLSRPYNFTAPGTRYDPSDACVATTGYDGFEVNVYRIFRRPGSQEVVRREKWHVDYTPLDTVICGSPPR